MHPAPPPLSPRFPPAPRQYLPCGFDPARDDSSAPEWGRDTVDRDGLCTFWFAGGDIKAGDEVCSRYGYLAPDQVGAGGCDCYWAGWLARLCGRVAAWRLESICGLLAAVV